MKIQYKSSRIKNHKITKKNFFDDGFPLTLYHTIPTFNDPKEDCFGKHWGKEKMLATSIFYSPHGVFYSIKERNHHFSNL